MLAAAITFEERTIGTQIVEREKGEGKAKAKGRLRIVLQPVQSGFRKGDHPPGFKWPGSRYSGLHAQVFITKGIFLCGHLRCEKHIR